MATLEKKEIESPALGVVSETFKFLRDVINFDQVLPKLQRTEQDPRPVALMTCGMAGNYSQSNLILIID